MSLPQGSLIEIAESELKLFHDAESSFGEYYGIAVRSSVMLSTFIKSVDSRGLMFIRFMSQVKKHHTLALFSTVRLHQVQAMLDLRYTIESAVAAAYALAFHQPGDFAELTDLGTWDSKQKFASRRNQWLNEHHPQASEYLKSIKDYINNSHAHANMVYTSNNLIEGDGHASAPFFDVLDEYYVKTDLWMLSGVGLSIVDLLYGENEKLRIIEFSDDLGRTFNEIRVRNEALREEMRSGPRFIAAEELMQKKGD